MNGNDLQSTGKYRGPHSEVTSGDCKIHPAPNDIRLCPSAGSCSPTPTLTDKARIRLQLRTLMRTHFLDLTTSKQKENANWSWKFKLAGPLPSALALSCFGHQSDLLQKQTWTFCIKKESLLGNFKPIAKLKGFFPLLRFYHWDCISLALPLI